MVKYSLLILCGFLVGAIMMENKQYLQREIPTPVAVLPDAGRYDGGIKKQQFHGAGRISWPNGDYYKGEFKAGLFHGHGLFETASMRYRGDFFEGAATGKGKISYSDGAFYSGDVEAATPHGYGTLEAGGSRYKGSFEHGVYHGHGELMLANNDHYIGLFSKGNYQGRGIYTTADKERYSGYFEQGEFTGEGSFLSADVRYEGHFKQWQFHGAGVYYDNRGGKFTGEFVNGQLQGSGEYIGGDGSVYRGEFNLFQYHGEGTLMTRDGDAYSGGFYYGQYHGDGVLSYAQPVDGIKVVKGRWRRGVLIESLTPGFTTNPDELVEQALYNQKTLLNKQWQQLQASHPDIPNMYFLGIAGDGTQGVFRREVLYVKEYFDKHYATEGRSMALINGDKTFATHPLATTTSIALTLDAMADRMDSNKDILFVYLSSHGSQDFQLSLNQHSIRLKDLSAENLASMLKDLPVRWKVIVVSSCYSGGFIPALKDNYTLIITAASPDKTSFGCSDRNEFTYFGEAYFKDALPAADNFLDAFTLARAIVAEREASEGFESSKPLIYKPSRIVKQLATWREGLKAVPYQ